MNKSINTPRVKKNESKSIEWFVRGGFSVMLVILVIIGSASYLSIHQLVNATAERRYTHETLLNLERLLSHLLGAESGQRGYVITGNEQYLHIYDEDLKAAEHDFANIRALDRGRQEQRINMLQFLLTEKIDMFRKNIDLRQRQGFEAAAQGVATGGGKKIMDAIRALIHEMNAEETFLLEKANDEVEAKAVLTEYVITLGGVVAFLFVVVSGWFIKRNVRIQKRMQEDLRESEEKLRAILDNATAVIYVKDLQGRFLLVNRIFKEIFHLEDKDIVHKTNHEVFEREIAESFHRNDQKVLQTGRAIEFEEVAIVDDVQHSYISLKFPLWDLSGKPYAVCGISTDITDRKHMATELEAAKQTAESASRAKSEFLTAMSHELRTPLNAIIGFSEVLQMQNFGALNKKQIEYVSDVLQSGKHLLSLINDILDLSKVEAGKMELQLGECLLFSIIQSSVSMVKEKASRHGIGIAIDVDDGIDMIRVDERKLKQIMSNLLSNAVKFTPNGGLMGIEVRRGQNRALEVSVWDTGIGIEDKDKEKIFKEFIQVVHSSSLRRKGTGLGLVLTKKMVELHGGNMWFESEGKNKGARFSFTLPQAIVEQQRTLSKGST